MEKIIRIIYDKSIKHSLLNLTDIMNILALVISNKQLDNYISNIEVQKKRCKTTASYSEYNKKIIIYKEAVMSMIQNLCNNLRIINNFEKTLYINLSIFQVILHEIEHANQLKKIMTVNDLETFIIRISRLVNFNNSYLYEYAPHERFAEIISYTEIKNMLYYIIDELNELPSIINTEILQRLLRRYHFSNDMIQYPINTYFQIGEKAKLLEVFEWYSQNNKTAFLQVAKQYNYQDRLLYGFPISTDEYFCSMKKLIFSLNSYFSNRINIKL